MAVAAWDQISVFSINKITQLESNGECCPEKEAEIMSLASASIFPAFIG